MMKRPKRPTRKERNRARRPISLSSTTTGPIPYNASAEEVAYHLDPSQTRGRPRINPRTPGEWQEAVNAARDALALDSAFQYGLVENSDGSTESPVNVGRCLRILAEGKRRGIVPTEEPS